MSTQVTNPNVVKFPLVKFSHHLGPNGTKSHTWTHVNYRNDLELVLRDIPVVDDFGNHEIRSWMKVIGGSEILESQNLSQLAIFSQEHSSLSGEQPIEIVVKCPFLAMKYPKTTNTIRRIQVKFRKESDFIQVIKTLIRLGLSVVDKESSAPLSTAIPSIQPNPSSMSNICNANTSISQAGLTSLSVSQGNSVSRGVSLLSQTKPRFNNHQRLDSSFPGEYRSQPEILHPNLCAPKSFTHNQLGSRLNPASSFSRPSCLEDAENSWSSFQSQDKLEFQNRHMSQPIIPKPSFGLPEISIETEHPFSHENILEGKTASQLIGNESGSLSAPSQSWPLINEDSYGVQIKDKFCKKDTQDNNNYQNIYNSQIKTFDEQKIWIPPKRELPFLKPNEHRKKSPSPLEDLAPLPRPTPITQTDLSKPNSIKRNRKPGSNSPSTRSSQQRTKVVKSPAKLQPISNSMVGDKTVEENSVSLPKNHVLIPTNIESKAASSATKRVASAHSGLKNKRKKMVDQSTQTEIEIGHDKEIRKSHNKMRTSKFPDIPSAPVKSIELGVMSIEDSSMMPKGHKYPENILAVPRYTEAVDEVRNSLVQNFIIDNLESKEFLQLCKDIEFSWQKIILGI